MEPAPRDRFSSLAAQLTLLASEARLELLHALRAPKALHEIHIRPATTAGELDPGRPLSRQTVTHHIEQLERHGLVLRVPDEQDARRERYVLNHERLFAAIDELRNLARLRPVAGRSAPPGATMDRTDADARRMPDPPRLVVAYGREDGEAFSLAGPDGAAWTIGRAPDCSIRLDYDPFVSSVNTRIDRQGAGFVVHDLGSSRNGTWVNWVRLPKGSTHDLRAGDAIIVGRTTLVFQG